MPEFARPKDDIRYSFGGLRTSNVPDAIPPNKYPVAINVRALRESSLQTRPGQTLKFATGFANAITDISTYAALSTDDLPRILARDTADKIWLDNSTLVGTLAGAGSGKGAAMIPFRPGASPNPYMYVANGSDYQKFSAPSAVNVVAMQNVGIAEPQDSPDMALQPSIGGSAVPTTETRRPTAFINPGVVGASPWTNPAFAIDGNPLTFAEAVSSVGTPFLFCEWNTFTAPTNAYTTYKLIVTYLCVNPNFGVPGFVAGVQYSLDGGATFTFVALGDTGGTQVNFVVDLPLGQDYTKIIVQGSVFSDPPYVVSLRFYDIRTEGTVAGGFLDETGLAAAWTLGGTATAIIDVTGPGDTGLAVIEDPFNPFIWSVGFQFNTNPPYFWQVGQTMTQGLNEYLILDVIQPGLTGTISAIRYFSGTTGRCIIVPSNLPASGVPTFQGKNPQASSFLSPNAIAALRRGAVLNLGGTEYVYVLSVTVGPNNTIAIETSTTGTHTATESLTTTPTMVVFGGVAPTTGAANLNANWLQGSLTTGVGTFSRVVNFFANVNSQAGLQDDDYLHFSIAGAAPQDLVEMTFAFDVGDGSFTGDYFYYTVRPNDLTPALTNTASQLAAAQVVAQRQAIDALTPNESGNAGATFSGAQFVPGPGQRTEILIPVRALTRVGRSLQTLVDTGAIRMTVTCTANTIVFFGSMSVWGGGQPDVGEIGSPYFYRVRPRSKVTGVVGNPSPASRYGVNPLRFPVTLSLPSASYDSQIDTWDIFRYGGSITSWRYIGSTPSASSTFTDDFTDDAALAGDALDFDNFQPWPSIDLPANDNASMVVGTSAVIVSTRDITKYLPGTLVQFSGQNVYTLRKRPTLLTGTNYLLDLIENAGALTNVTYNIQEPIIAQQRLPYMWGPDASGTVFACGDQLRPGNIYFAKNYAPDNAPDAYNIELSPPSEPLLGGEILDGLSFVASAERWWALYPQPDNPQQRYNPVQQPFLRGLVAPYGHCNDGVSIYSWAKDGIYSSTSGSLTDEDLYNLFPHEGVIGRSVTYGGITFQPPDYSRAGTFRLSYASYYLYALYQDATGTYHCLTYDTRRKSWCEDIYTPTLSAVYHPRQQAGTLLTNTARYDELLMGTVDGRVATQANLTNDLGAAIFCAVATAEFNGGDIRAPKQWGDTFIDSVNAAVAGVNVTAMANGVAIGPTRILPTSTARTQQPMSIGGIVVAQYLGLLTTWTDDFTIQDVPTQLNAWQPSFAIQPATDVEFFTFGSSFGFNGFMHIQQLSLAWVSTAPITITIVTFDGQSPAPLVIPSSAGAYQKALFQLTPNKGQLYKFAFSSTAPFQVFFDDCEVPVGEWGRNTPYDTRKNLGGMVNATAAI